MLETPEQVAQRKVRSDAVQQTLDGLLEYAYAALVGIGLNTDEMFRYSKDLSPKDKLNDLLESALSSGDLEAGYLGHFDVGAPLQPVNHWRLKGLKAKLLRLVEALPEE